MKRSLPETAERFLHKNKTSESCPRSSHTHTHSPAWLQHVPWRQGLRFLQVPSCLSLQACLQQGQLAQWRSACLTHAPSGKCSVLLSAQHPFRNDNLRLCLCLFFVVGRTGGSVVCWGDPKAGGDTGFGLLGLNNDRK